MKLKEKLAIRYLRMKFRLLSFISKKKAAEKAFELFCTPQFRNKKDLPPFFQQAEKLDFSFREFFISGYRWNKGADRKAMIIHGFESSVVNFGQYASDLVKKGYEVLAFDAPAHGRSSGRQINAIVYRDFLKHIYHDFGPVQTFIAHSFGGLSICMALAELEHTTNTKLVLIAPATETKTALDLFFDFLELNDPKVREEFEEIIVNISGHIPAWFSIGRALKTIHAKILWIHDEDDTTTPLKDMLEIQQEKHDNIEYLVTRGLGHRRIYRDAEVNRKIVEFV